MMIKEEKLNTSSKSNDFFTGVTFVDSTDCLTPSTSMRSGIHLKIGDIIYFRHLGSLISQIGRIVRIGRVEYWKVEKDTLEVYLFLIETLKDNTLGASCFKVEDSPFIMKLLTRKPIESLEGIEKIEEYGSYYKIGNRELVYGAIDRVSKIGWIDIDSEIKEGKKCLSRPKYRFLT